MRNKISIYLFMMKIKYIFLTLFFMCLFIQIINLLEVSRIIESQNSNITSIIYLSLLKLPTTILDIIPFVIIISTAFFYRYLITNNELISMRNIGYSILDIFKPVGTSVLIVSLLFLLIINPLSSFFEKKFEAYISKDISNLYSIKINNNEIWIKNINLNQNNFIKFSDVDLKKMEAKNIKILEIIDDQYNIYVAKKGTVESKVLNLENVKIFNVNTEIQSESDFLNLNVNFNKDDIINSVSNYKHIPFYKYSKHLKSLKKFNLLSPEVSFFYTSEIFKPIFLVILSFLVMGFASKFKRNENFFKILFFSISIGFSFYIFKEILSALTISKYLSYWLAYLIMIITSLIIGLYQSINIEIN